MTWRTALYVLALIAAILVVVFGIVGNIPQGF